MGAAVATASVMTGPMASAQEAASEPEVIVTGTRSRDRTVLNSPSPVDVLSADALQSSGAVGDELGQALATLTPSFNFPRQSNSGTSDHIRAAQLRGLSPDQTLVLVNGRRRNQSAVVNSETKIGRGTAAVDFNTIPLGAVGRVEVLRDGAGAQYGSDAIAGVINVILDDAPEGAEFSASYGQHVTSLDPINDDITDGETYTLALEGALPLGGRGGFVRGGGEYISREGTNRAGFDQVPFFVDPTPANLALAGQRNYAEGDPEVESYGLWFNSELPLAGEALLYAFGTITQRDTSGGGAFFRYPDSFENITAVYPNGYRPQTTGDDENLSISAGLWNQYGPVELDLGLTYGRNEFRYGVENSLNPSLGPTSPTSFFSGAYIFDQLTLNADARTDWNVGVFASPVTVAFGAEYRRETYETQAGQPESYIAGPLDLAIGAQAAPGLTPDDVVDIDRDVVSLYVDLSADVTDRLFVNAAGRFEDYSDFGETWTGKLAGLFELAPNWNLRAAVSNSVRAPGLQQIGFSDTTLNFGVGRSLVRTRTLRVDDPIAQSLGAQDLDPEESFNISAGIAAQPTDRLRFSIDVFQIQVDDRVTLSDRFFGPALEAFVQAQPGGADIQSVRFFTNAIDTETQGVDLVVGYTYPVFGGDMDLSFAYSYAETEITGFRDTPGALLALDPSFRLIGVEEINTIETAAPNDKIVASAEWTGDQWRFLGRVNYYGEATRVFNFGGGFEPAQTYGSEIQVDAEAEFTLNQNVSFTVGASNLLDEYPDLSSADINYFGNLPYDILSPIGVNGRFVYARTRVTF
jgi:iron complex outermembrane receptor protein